MSRCIQLFVSSCLCERNSNGLTNVHWRPGTGKIDWEALMQALSHIGFDGVISIELEDVPGVSRGREAMHGAYRSTVSAGAAFDHENALSLAYLKEICGRLGIGGGDYATFGTPRENTDYRWWQ